MAAGAHYLDLADGGSSSRVFRTMSIPPRARSQRTGHLGREQRAALSSAGDRQPHRASPASMKSRSRSLRGSARRARSAIAAVLGYAGAFKWRSRGAWRDAWGWQELKRMRFYGLAALGRRLRRTGPRAFPKRYPGVRTMEFRSFARARHAATGALVRGAAAPARRAPADRALGEAARPDGRVDGRLGRPSRRNAGERHGEAAERKPRADRMAFTADAQARPEIPCMAAILLARKLAAKAASRSRVRSPAWGSSRCRNSSRSSRAGASPRW